MKTKYFLIIGLLAATFAACSRDEESLFDKPAAIRTQEALENATDVLTGAEYGWEMIYFPNLEDIENTRGFVLIAKFNKNSNVSMTAKNSVTTSNKIKTDSASTWVIKSDYGPLLSFDTYNSVFHMWSDPGKVFGKGEIAKLPKLIEKGRKILMTYGGGSIKRNGVYEQVMKALEGYDIVEFSGIEANPDYSTLMKAVDICKTQNIDFILAVGGGSIIDGTKFIATAAKFEGEDAWDILSKKEKLPKPMDFASVLTLPATASEMNNGAVISRRDRQEKLAFHNPEGYPKFSILDPDVVLSLPAKQISNGIVDIYAHTLEQYLTTCLDTKVMDRWAESLLLTLIEEAPELLSENPSYDSRANFMLTATMGLNGFISMGVDEDWATHMIGHELTALCGLDHGETLAIVHPGVMSVMRKEKHGKLLQYARRVWNITNENEEQAIDEAIERTENFFRSIGKKTRLSEYGIGNDVIDTIVQRFTDRGWAVGEHGIVTPEKTRLILEKVL